MAGHERTLEHNHAFLDLLQLLLNAYLLIGNFQVEGRGKWFSMAAMVEYFEFVKYRACPLDYTWPELSMCLTSEWQSSAAWLPHLREGKTLSEAVWATDAERSGAWCWATLAVAAQ